jgi:iron complex outermembrane receptor protein
MKDLRIRKFLAVLSALAASSLTTSTGKAQATTTTPATPTTTQVTTTSTTTTTDQTPQTLEKFVVTGSYLPMSADAPAIPVTTVDVGTIENSGETGNLMQVLQKVQPQFSGSLNLGPTNGNIASNSTNGGSQLALRNFPTLVLINGHRAAFAPVDSVGGYQYVDLNLIPVAAVEKVEILTDGGSAIYGSDAVGGVINVILKTNYEGFEVDTRYGWSTGLVTGSFTERSTSITGGVSNGKTSITISAEYSSNTPLYQYQVSTSQYTTGTTNYPGVINIYDITSGPVANSYYLLNPALNAPPVGNPQSLGALVNAGIYSGPYSASQIISKFNLSSKPTSVIGSSRESFIADFDHSLNDNLKLSGTLMYAETNTFSQLNAQPFAELDDNGDPYNPVLLTSLPSANDYVEVHNRFTTNPRQYLTDTDSAMGILSLDGTVNSDISWTTSGDYNIQHENFQNPNLVYTTALNNTYYPTAAAPGNPLLNLYAHSQAPGATAASDVFGTAFGVYDTTLLTYDAVIKDNKLFSLPGGDVSAAVGGQFRRESLGSTADYFSLAATFSWDSGTSISPLNTARTIWGEYGQLDVPIVSEAMKVPGIYSLSLIAAVRHEAYQGINQKPTDPLFALRYQPFDDEVTVRASYTKSFIAPSLFELYGPTTFGFSNDLTQFQPYGGGAVIGNDGQVNEQNGSNPALQPTLATNYSVGVVYSPKAFKGLTVSADFYRIEETSLVESIYDVYALQSVELLGPASPYAQYTALVNYVGQPGSKAITAPGQISGNPTGVYFTNSSINTGDEKYEGIDIAVDYTFELPGIGRFDLANKDTVNMNYFLDSAGSPGTEAAAMADGTVGTIPRFRGYTSLQYGRGGWSALLANTYITAVTDDGDGEHINYYTSWDGSIGYTFSQSDFAGEILKGLTLKVGVNDIFNRQPSTDYNIFSTDDADISTYSPIARFVYVEGKYRF